MAQRRIMKAFRVERGRLRRRLRPDLSWFSCRLEDRTLLNGSITVSTTNDLVDGNVGSIALLIANPGADGSISLREAIEAANNTPSAAGTPNTITLPDGTYNLTTGTAGTGGTAELGVAPDAANPKNLNTVIVGTSQAGTIINQTVGGARIFDVDLNSNGNILFSASNLTIQNGTSTDGGGAVLMGGVGDQVSFTNVLFKNNKVTVTATNAPGGAIEDAGGTLTITNSTFDTNSVGTVGTTNLGSSGGAIDLNPNNDSTLIITGTTFTNNKAAASASGAGGGAIRITRNGNAVTANISGSTFTGNQVTSGATSGGGAIYLESGSLTVADSNFSGNQITASGGGEDAGGAIYAGGTLVANFNRFVNNSTAKGGAGNEIDFNAGNGGTVNIEDNWWGHNTGPAVGDVVQTSPTAPLSPTHWLVLTNSANPATINLNATSSLTADFKHDNAGTDVSALDPAPSHTFPAFIGLPVTYGAPVHGTLSNQQTTIQSGGTATATFTGTSGGSGSSTATVDGVTATANINVVNPNASLSVVGTGPTYVGEASNLTYTFTISNAGPSSATGVSLTDVLPSGATFNAALSTPGAAVAGQTVTYSGLGPIASGGSLPITIVATTTEETALSNSATADATNATTHNVASNTVATTVAESNLTTTLTPISPIVGAAFNGQVATFTDTGSTDPNTAFSATIFWGDSTSSSGTIGGANGNYTVSGVHTYAAAGANLPFSVLVTENNVAQLFTASLSGAQEVPPHNTPATGSASVLLNALQSTITVNENFSGLLGNAAASHIHGAAPAGVNAPVLFPLSGVPAAPSGAIPEQSFAITPARVLQLESGLFYFNVHTVPFPGGEIRGQINNPGFSSGNVTVTAQADVTIVKTGPATALADGQITYQITVHNNGPSDAQNAFTSDTLPAHTTLVSFTQDTGPAAGGPLPAGGTETFTLVLHVDANTPDGTVITNTANVSTTTPDPNLATNGVSTVDTTVFNHADVVVTKTGPATVIAGNQITYQITTHNNGPSDAQDVTTSDTLPAHTTLVSFTQDTGPAAGGPLPAGGTETFTLVLHVDANTPDGTVITNTANVSTTTPDPNLATNGQSTVDTTVIGHADLIVTKTATPTAIAGNQVTYTITIQNAGPSDAQGVSVADALPSTTTFVSQSQTLGGAQFTLAHNGNAINDTIATLAAGASQTFTVTATVNPGTPAGPLGNSATAMTTTLDPNLGAHGISTATTIITTQADLVVTKTATPSAIAGNQVTYTITLQNNGPSDAQGVSMADSLPAGTTFVSQSQSFLGPQFTLNNNGNAINDAIFTLAAGASQTFTVTATVNPGTAAGIVSNTATASTSTSDPNLGIHGSATAHTNVTTQADMSVVKTGPATSSAGGQITYTITVHNNGPSDARNVALADALPAGFTLVSQSQTAGGAQFTLGNTGNTVQDTLGDLIPGASQTFTVLVQIGTNAVIGASVKNTATVTSTTPDNVAGNNSSMTSTMVTSSADLSLGVVATYPANLGGVISYVFTVTNNGPSDALNVQFLDQLALGTSFISVGQSGGPAFTFTHSPTQVMGTLAKLPAGATATIQIQARYDSIPGKGKSGANVATVSSSTFDPTSLNNTTSSSRPFVAGGSGGSGGKGSV